MKKEYKTDALEFVRKNHVCHMATVEENRPVSRVMWTVKADDDFTLWFVSRASSQKMKQLEKNPAVCLTVFEAVKDVRVFGKGFVIEDEDLKNRLWKEEWRMYFPKGKEDPEYQLIRVEPQRVEYRDGKTMKGETISVM